MPRGGVAAAIASMVLLLLSQSSIMCQAGASAYTLLQDVESELSPGGAILEIGSDRGEGSTRFLSEFANSTRREFFSIDFSNEGFENAQSVCGSCAHQSMGEVWLEEVFMSVCNSRKIDFAYLDNYDWTYPWTAEMQYKKQQHVDYGARGLLLSNEISQHVHYQQAVLVAKHCSERCFVLFDDTWPSAKSSPDKPSYTGWVLVRRLQDNQHHEVIDGCTNEEHGDEASGKTHKVHVQFTYPVQGDTLFGNTLEIKVSVSGALDGEHTLVVYDQGMEMLRYTDWALLPLQPLQSDGYGDIDSVESPNGVGDSEWQEMVFTLATEGGGSHDVTVEIINSFQSPVASARSTFVLSRESEKEEL